MTGAPAKPRPLLAAALATLGVAVVVATVYLSPREAIGFSTGPLADVGRFIATAVFAAAMLTGTKTKYVWQRLLALPGAILAVMLVEGVLWAAQIAAH